MSSDNRAQATSALEAGFAAIPLQASETGCVRLAIVVRLSADPATGHSVLIRQLPIAKVLLGCLQDHRGNVLDWVEIWIQETASAAESANSVFFTNVQLDDQWQRLVRTFREVEPDSHISSSFETAAPLPIYLNLKQRAVFHPRQSPEGAFWELCRDDQLLQSAQLPAYSSSQHRYLYTRNQGASTEFVPLTMSAPENSRTVPADVPAAGTETVSINPAAGLMLLRKFAPLGLEEYADLLVGKPWRGVENARSAMRLNGVYRTLQDDNAIRCGGAHLFSSSTGRSGRFTETLHLKLQITTQACRIVRDYISRTQLPLLNLTAESFRLRLFPAGAGLPLLWTGRVTLDRPGAAIALPIANSRTRVFRSAEPLTPSIYRPESLGLSTEGVASVRIRKILPPVEEGTVIEGTFSTQERLHPDRNDLASFQIPLSNGHATLIGYLDRGEKLPEGELRFRSIPQTLGMQMEAWLRDVQGIPFNDVRFEIVPPLSSPCDLYALAVLAIRVLLVNPRVSLPYALDAMLSLARQLANEFDESRPIGDRVRQIVAKERRWQDALGPQHLLHEEISAEETEKFLPAKLWWDVLALLVRFFPGIGPDSFCRDFGDAQSLALENIFDEPLHQLDQLCLRSRSLLLLNWKQHVEIAGVIHSIEESLQ